MTVHVPHRIENIINFYLILWGDDQDMMWHLHYDDLIRHKIFKFLISAYFFQSYYLIWTEINSKQHIHSKHFTEYLLQPDITCPKTIRSLYISQPTSLSHYKQPKIKSHSITEDSPMTSQPMIQKVSPLASISPL